MLKVSLINQPVNWLSEVQESHVRLWYDFLLGGCGNIKTIFGLIFMTLLKKSEERTTHQNWILVAETAELFMSFYICHVPNFISLPQTKELSIRIQGRKVADHDVEIKKRCKSFERLRQ